MRLAHSFLRSRKQKPKKSRASKAFGVSCNVFNVVVLGYLGVSELRTDRRPDIDLSYVDVVQNLVEGSAQVPADEAQAKSLLQSMFLENAQVVAQRYDELNNHVAWNCGYFRIYNCAPDVRAEVVAYYEAYEPSHAYATWRDDRLGRVVARIEDDAAILKARVTWDVLNVAERMSVVQRMGKIYSDVYAEDGLMGDGTPIEMQNIAGRTLAQLTFGPVPFGRNSKVIMDESSLYYSDFNSALGYVLHELEHATQIYLGDVRLLGEGKDYLRHHNIEADAIIFAHSFGFMRFKPEKCDNGVVVPSKLYWSSPIEKGARLAQGWAKEVAAVHGVPMRENMRSKVKNINELKC